MHTVIGEHPPDHVAPHGTLWQDRDGLHWEQKNRAILLGHVGEHPVMGGRDWQVFSPHGTQSGILWSSSAFSRLLSVAYNIDHVFAGTQSATDSYHTLFPLRHTFRLKAMVLPVYKYGEGNDTVNVKLGLYVKQTDLVGWSFKLADQRLLFKIAGVEPNGGSPLMIPFNSETQDGLILRKGCELYVRAVWGAAMNTLAPTKWTARYPYEFSETGDNCFRSDRYVSGGSNFTQDISDLMSTEYGTVFGTSLSGNTTSMARIDWGMYGDFLD